MLFRSTRESFVSELEKTINPNDNSFLGSESMKELSGDKKMAYQCALLCALGVQFFRYGTEITEKVKIQPDFKSLNKTLNESFINIVKEYILDKGTVAKMAFSYLGDDYEAVYKNLIKKGILHSINDEYAILAISKEELDQQLNCFAQDKKDKILSILR